LARDALAAKRGASRKLADGMKKAGGRTGFFRTCARAYCAGAGSAGAGSVAGGVAGSAGAGAGSVAPGTLSVVVVSVESLQAATVSKARADTEARTSFFITVSLVKRPPVGADVRGEK
jgi:hypothetical protein